MITKYFVQKRQYLNVGWGGVGVVWWSTSRLSLICTYWLALAWMLLNCCLWWQTFIPGTTHHCKIDWIMKQTDTQQCFTKFNDAIGIWYNIGPFLITWSYSLAPSDAIGWHRFGSTLAQAMACGLVACRLTNVSAVGFSGFYLRAILLQVRKIPTC